MGCGAGQMAVNRRNEDGDDGSRVLGDDRGTEDGAKQKATGPVCRSKLPESPSRVGVSKVAIGQAPKQVCTGRYW